MWKTLDAFGFNSNFIKYIKVFYSDIESLLKINGGLCAPFKIKRGVRQECSLSGMLYTIVIEPLLQRLRTVLEGVSLKDYDGIFKLSAYADDVVVFINSQTDVDSLWRTLKDFELISAAKVNWSKREAVLMGKWMNGTPNLPGGLVWSKNGFKYLGVYLGDESFQVKNWEGTFEKLKGRLNKWNWIKPSLSYRGSTLVINNLVASSLWHRLTCVEPPSYLLAKIQSMLLDFLWDKMHWITHSILYLPKDEGGQGLVNLQSRTATFRMQFIQRFLTGPETVIWKTSGLCYFKDCCWVKHGKKHFFLMNSINVNFRKLSVFYQNLFKVCG